MHVRAVLAFLLAFSLGAGCVGAPTSSSTHDAASLTGAPLSFLNATIGKAPCVNCYEPAIAVDGQGRMFLAANNMVDASTSGIMASEDGGATFQPRPCNPPAGPFDSTGKPGGASDDVVQAAPWGTVFYTELWSDGGGVAGAGVHVCASDDAGRTWKTNTLILLRTQPGSRAIITDRQWLAFEPDRTVHLLVNGLLSQLIYDFISHDEGKTWQDPVVVVTAAQHNYPAPEGLPFVSSDDYIVTPFWVDLKTDGSTGARGLAVSSSHDHGKTWTVSRVYTHPGNDGSSGGSWPAATSYPNNGTWVVAWETNDDRILLAFSEDHGATWKPPVTIPKEVNGGVNGHPAVHARQDGALDLVYFAPGPSTRALRFSPSGHIDVATIADKAGGSADYPYFDHTPDGRIATAVLTPQCSSNTSPDCALLVETTNT